MVPVSNENSDLLGAWEGSDLTETVHTNIGIGSDTDLPEHVRFIAGVAKLIRRRMAKEGADTDPVRPAVFLLEPNASTNDPENMPKRVPMLDNGLTVIAGRLWFVSPIVVMGKYIDLKTDDDDALFSMVTEGLSLGDVPAIVFDPRTEPPSVRFYPDGLADAENRDTIDLTREVSLQQIFEAIDRVYENCLITPEGQGQAGKLWADGARWRPSAEAEDIIQLYLRAGLITAFPTCVVRHEQTSVAGRYDLGIEESAPTDRSQVTRHAVLELKVLRSFGSTGTSVSAQEVLDWVKSGVKQAASYRDDVGAREAALCCFDMRKEHSSGEECFKHVKGCADKLVVVLKHWFIFGTSEQYREFKTAGR